MRDRSHLRGSAYSSPPGEAVGAPAPEQRIAAKRPLPPGGRWPPKGVGRGTATSYGRDAAWTAAEKWDRLFYLSASYDQCCAVPLQSASLTAIYYGMISTGDHGYFYPLREHSPRGSGRCSRTGATHRRAEAHFPPDGRGMRCAQKRPPQSGGLSFLVYLRGAHALP